MARFPVAFAAAAHIEPQRDVAPIGECSGTPDAALAVAVAAETVEHEKRGPSIALGKIVRQT